MKYHIEKTFMGSFNHELCCEHTWILEKLNLDGTPEEYCNRCGAICKRDKDGQIEQFSLFSEYTHKKIERDMRTQNILWNFSTSEDYPRD